MSMNAESALESPDPGTLLGGERRTLELIATGAPLETILDALCRVIDEQSGLMSSIFLLDGTGERLALAAGPHLPELLRAAVASFPVTVTACGAAVTRREQIISPDIASDQLYAGFHDVAQRANVRAVWSTPFFSRHDRPLGTFAVYNSVTGRPSRRNLELVSRATHLASIAVEHHRTEQGLRESEIRFSRAFYASPACMLIWSFSDGRFLLVNDAFVRLFGYSRAETLGQSAISLGLYADPEQRPAMVQRLLEGTLHEIEIQGRKKSGETLDLILSMERIELLGEQSVLAIATDITDRKRAEQAVRVSERRWRSVFDNSAIGIVMGDSTLRVTAANRALQALGGYSEQELSALTLFDVTHPDDRHLVEQAVDDLLAGARERQIEKRFLRKSGEVIWVRTTASLIQEANEPLRFLALLEDISARKAAEQKLAESLSHLRALAARLMQTQDDERRRIARMLHETTAQDLAGLKMLLARLNRTCDRLSDADRVLLDDSVQLADRSMNELRTLAYLLHPPFLDDVGLLSAVRWYAQGFADRSGIEVTLDLPETLERLAQDVETTLFRVIQEALINIHRHAESPTASLRLRIAAGRLTLEIEDHGRGMPPDFVARLMAGTGAIGVGLAGMRERLEQLGGALGIESNKDRTVVRAIVPVPETAS
jgi:PAS domain S-box-containing protein